MDIHEAPSNVSFPVWCCLQAPERQCSKPPPLGGGGGWPLREGCVREKGEEEEATLQNRYPGAPRTGGCPSIFASVVVKSTQSVTCPGSLPGSHTYYPWEREHQTLGLHFLIYKIRTIKPQFWLGRCAREMRRVSKAFRNAQQVLAVTIIVPGYHQRVCFSVLRIKSLLALFLSTEYAA